MAKQGIIKSIFYLVLSLLIIILGFASISFFLIQSWSPEKHFQLSQAYYQQGHEEKAKRELTLGKKLYQVFSFLDFDKKMVQSLVQTEKIVFQKEEIEKEIKNLEEELKNKPFSQDILLKLSLDYFKLYEQEKALYYFQKASYLDPNGELVKSVGEIIRRTN